MKQKQRIAIAYMRVSTSHQVEDGDSLAAQKQAAQQFADQRDLQLVNCFSDPGKSGRSQRGRPGLAKALAKVKAVKGILLVRSLSRLARSVIDLHTILTDLQSAGADLGSINECIDTSTAAGRAFFGFLAVMAQFESDLTSDRIKEAYTYRRSIGDPIKSGVQPYGWLKNLAGEIVKDYAAQETIAQMVDWRTHGHSCKEIAKKLNHLKIKTPDQHCKRKRPGIEKAKWHPGSVHHLLAKIPGTGLKEKHGRAVKLKTFSREQLKLLGTMTDSAAAARLGCSRIHVIRARKQHKIPAYKK